MLDHLERVGLNEWYGKCAGVPPGVPWWLDHVLYDIENTLMAAVRNAHRAGARAVTLYEPLTRLTKYAGLIKLCQDLKMAIATANAPGYERRIWWVPE